VSGNPPELGYRSVVTNGLPNERLELSAGAIVGIALVGAGTFFSQAVATSYTGAIATEHKAAASGLYLAAYYSGGIVGAIALGAVYGEWGWHGCVVMVTLSLALMAAIAALTWTPPIVARPLASPPCSTGGAGSTTSAPNEMDWAISPTPIESRRPEESTMHIIAPRLSSTAARVAVAIGCIVLLTTSSALAQTAGQPQADGVGGTKLYPGDYIDATRRAKLVRP